MIKISDLCFAFKDTTVFEHLNLHIPDGEITALMAPSGKGKSTLLRLIAGLIKPDSGSIELGGRSVGIMFQEPRLFSQLTVFQNVMLVMPPKKDGKRCAMKLLEIRAHV